MKKYIGFLLALLSLAACTGEKKQKTTGPEPAKDSLSAGQLRLTDAQLRNAGIKTGKVALSDLHRGLLVNGTVEVPPEHRYSISFPMAGYLKSTRLIPGTYVAKGALLATLEDARFIQLQQDYLVGKSRLAYVEADFKRQEELNKTQSNSDKVLQQARADYESQKVLVRALMEQLRLIGIAPERLNESNISRSVNIYAPISGYVSQVNVNPGKYISPSDVLFEVIDVSRLHLSLTVFEKDVRELKPGQKVICHTNTEPGKTMAATIHLVSRNVRDDRSLDVHCDFDQHYPGLMPGTFINAEIQQENAAANAVPEAAVVRWQNKYYIFVVTGQNSFQLQEVTTGKTVNGQVEIVSAVPSQDIVLDNAYALLMMLKNSGDEG